MYHDFLTLQLYQTKSTGLFLLLMYRLPYSMNMNSLANLCRVVLSKFSISGDEFSHTPAYLIYEPHRKKHCLWGFRSGLTQVGPMKMTIGLKF